MKRITLAMWFMLLPVLAFGQIISGGQKQYQPLYETGVSVGNGADLTEDTLASFTIAAGQLANVGDRLHVIASGTLGATTDSKTIRLKIGTFTSAGSAATAASTHWRIELDAMKIGSNTQTVATWFGTNVGNNSTPVSSLGTMTDTGTLALTVTGQNATSSVAGSITCRYLTVDYIPNTL